MKKTELYITSAVDNTAQPSIFFESPNPYRPLLVGLHTWSFGRENQIKNLLPIAEKYDFNLLLPEFRGPNLPTNPDCKNACGSHLAKSDIKDAIDYVGEIYKIDKNNIFLLGLSGGGHMAILMAGFCPEYFRAIGAFVPITNLVSWAEYSSSYRNYILACCGSEEEMENRSPISYLDTVARSNLKIFHGKYDKVVPFTQSTSFYNELITRYPDAKVYLDIFDGGHQIDLTLATHWILSQYSGTSSVEVTG